ncbi:hypothetical protein HZZ00_10905 [Streptomyces sp. NEAU-sy36]|uniref:hypothetical protein n=1 Tax=unclassified Streptomyces TaxID=2593676 RepID=UPI0015D5D898|nr:MULTISPECIES: hypothetical protein [unclassified Streptomyces]QLJ01479.1 hypothetical protein HZZ00_10905 [Streptomyces sp. NEAU-sy36]
MSASTQAWPFGSDAIQDDPLTALRIPVVGSFRPMWRYVAAYLNTATPDTPDYLTVPPFASMERPTEAEAQMLASFIREYITHWFHEGYQGRLARRPLDVDSGCNTIIFVKYGPDDWGYGRVSWEYGPTFIPGPPRARGTEFDHPKHPGPLSLVQVMDLAHTICDEPMERWTRWKADHPEIFGAEAAR